MAYNAACWESLAGNADAAFALLERALALDAAEVRRHAEGDRDLDPLHDDPRWRELLA